MSFERLDSVIAVGFELENARDVAGQSGVVRSLVSVSRAALALRQREGVEAVIYLVRDSAFSPALWEKLMRVAAEFSTLDFRDIVAHDLRYFESKNLVAEKAEAEFVVLFDSDCVYLPDSLIKYMKSFRENPLSVAYGITYGRAGHNKVSIGSRLAWLFPPESIGYSRSWPKSRWANNFGLSRELFLAYPFPRLTLTRFPKMETKHERVIWESRLRDQGIGFHAVDAVAEHEQLDSLARWWERQFIHGLGTSARAKLEGFKLREQHRRIYRPLRERWSALCVLKKAGDVNRHDLLISLFLLWVAYAGRLVGLGAVKVLSISATVSWASTGRQS